MTVRVLLADDQALLRATFRIVIDSCDDMEVVAAAGDIEEVLSLARLRRPDVVVVWHRPPGVDGPEAIAAIRGDPVVDGTPVLMLAAPDGDEHVVRALRAGAAGVLGTDVTAEALLAGIRAVAGGDALLSPSATRMLITRFLAAPGTGDEPPAPAQLASLTSREREVVTLVALGRSNDEIAAGLVVSPLTVRTHVHRAMAKLAARDRAQLVALAYRSGLVRPAPPATAG